VTPSTNPQQPEPRLLKAVETALFRLRTKQLDALTPDQDARALAKFTEEMQELFAPIKITPVGQQPEPTPPRRLYLCVILDGTPNT
jgi:hypothetical protein